MGVPTGVKILTVTAGKQSLFRFTCVSCGRSATVPYRLKQKAEGSFHVLQSSGTRQRVSDTVQQQAAENLQAYDDRLFREINEEHFYESVIGKVVCPHCGAKQPWSGFPGKWQQKTKIRWIIGMALLGVLTLVILNNLIRGVSYEGFGALFCAAAVIGFIVVSVQPLIFHLRVSKARKTCAGANFIPPLYINRRNVDSVQE